MSQGVAVSSVLTWLCAMLFALTVSVSSGLCDSIAELRRKVQTVGADHVLFLDEVPFKLSEAPSHTIVLPGESAYVEVDDNSSYAPRYDMVAWLHAHGAVSFHNFQS
jgi:hypothetical protein